MTLVPRTRIAIHSRAPLVHHVLAVYVDGVPIALVARVGRDGMIRGEHKSRSAGFHARNIVGHLPANDLPIVGLEDPRIQPAQKRDAVPVLLGEDERIVVLRLTFHGMQGIEARFQDQGQGLGGASACV